jgi:hypothetical protein
MLKVFVLGAIAASENPTTPTVTITEIAASGNAEIAVSPIDENPSTYAPLFSVFCGFTCDQSRR